MSTYPPEIEAYVQSKIASGEFASREQFAVEAAKIYRDLEVQAGELRAEVQARLRRAGKGFSHVLDRDALKQEARQKFADSESQN